MNVAVYRGSIRSYPLVESERYLRRVYKLPSLSTHAALTRDAERTDGRDAVFGTSPAWDRLTLCDKDRGVSFADLCSLAMRLLRSCEESPSSRQYLCMSRLKATNISKFL